MNQPTEYTIGRIEQLIEDHAAQLSPSEIARRVGALLRSGSNGASSLVADEAVRPSRGVGKGHYPTRLVVCKFCGIKMSNRAIANHVRYNHPQAKKRGRPRKPGTGHYPVRMLECKICGEKVNNRAMGNHMATQHRGRKEIL